MKSLERRFSNIHKRNIYWAPYFCFAEAVKAQSFSRLVIHRWFNKLVKGDDYARSEKKEILSFLTNLSNQLRTTENGLKIVHHATKKKE